MKDNFIRDKDYYKSNIAILHDEEDGPVPWSVFQSLPQPPMDPSWHGTRAAITLRSLPPLPPPVASIFSTLIRGPIGRRHRIYYNLQRIFRWGALLLLPLPHRASPNDTRRYITKQGIVWGKRGQGKKEKGQTRRVWEGGDGDGSEMSPQ